jgi:hypothetical protein
MPRELFTIDPKGGLKPATDAEIVSAAASIYGRRADHSRRRRLTPKLIAQIKRWRAKRWTWTRIAQEAKVSRQNIFLARKSNRW